MSDRILKVAFIDYGIPVHRQRAIDQLKRDLVYAGIQEPFDESRIQEESTVINSQKRTVLTYKV